MCRSCCRSGSASRRTSWGWGPTVRGELMNGLKGESEGMGLKFPIFMDAQSTTPCDPRVVEAMLPYFTEKFGHPASRNHPFGWEAEGAVDAARAKIAALMGARDPKELVFTSGGTEAINLALKGVAEMYREKGTHIVTTVIEQRASIDTFKRIERQGF